MPRRRNNVEEEAPPPAAPSPLYVPASALILFPQGTNAPARGGVQILPGSFIKNFDALVEALNQRRAAIPDAPEIKTRLGPLKNACDRILDDIEDADRSRNKRFPDATLRHVDQAEGATTELYGWAKTIASGKLNAAEAMTKQAKLQVVPYIAALSYAARIRVVTRLVEREMASQESEKARHLDRACEIVDDVVALLKKALEKLMPDTSLLQVALDLDLPMAMYLTLMGRFRASVEAIRSPGAEPQHMPAFDDRLASLRTIFQWKPSGDDHQTEESIVELSSIQESLWWARFTDTDLGATHAEKIRETVTVREIACALGAGSAAEAAALEIKTGQKSALLQLPPASALRADLCAAIAHACHAAPPPRTFAATSAPPPPPDTIPRWLCCLPRTSRAPEMGKLRRAAAPRTLSGHTDWVYGVAVCPDGDRVLSASADCTVRLWRLSSGRHLRTLYGHTDSVNCVAVSPDGKMAVSGSDDKSVRVWSVESGVESGSARHTLRGHSNAVRAVAVSPDGRSIASGSWDYTVRLWNAESGQCHATLTGHSYYVCGLAFSPDGSTLISGSTDKSIGVWNVRSRALERRLQGHSNTVLGVAVTPDGRRVVSGGYDNTVRVWSVSSGAEEVKFEGHTGCVSSVAVFPDGLRVVSGSYDKSVRVWNLRSKALELTLTGHSDQVQCVAVSPDGRSVVSCSNDDTIKVWALSGGGLGRAR